MSVTATEPTCTLPAFAIHDGLLNERGLGLMANLLRMAQPDGAEYARLEPGTSVDL